MKPVTLFILLATGFGIVFALVTAPFHAPDEHRHYLRVFSYAMGSVWEPHAMPRSVIAYHDQVDARAWDQYYRKRDPSRPLYTLEEWKDRLRNPGLNRADSFIYDPLTNVAFIYSPIPYLPGILAMAAGYAVEAPPGLLLYLARFALLAAGIGVLAYAIRLLPIMQWPLCLVSLIPMTVFVRSSITTDTLTTGFAILLFSLVLRHIVSERAVGMKNIAVMSVVALLLSLCKSGYFLVPAMMLLIPRQRFSSPKIYVVAILSIVVLPIAASLGWNFAASGHVVQQGAPQGTSVHDQMRFILKQPMDYIIVLGKTFVSSDFIKNMVDRPLIGALGSLDRPIPHAVTYPYTLGLLLVLLSQGLNGWQPARWQRWLAGGLFLATLVIVLTLLYLQFTPVGHSIIIGFQGRYLYPILPLIMLALLPVHGLKRLAWFGARPALVITLLSIVGLGWGVWVMLSKDYVL